jgi:general secretion pathway protein H
MLRSKQAQRGYSLVELLVVILVIAILAAVSIPSINRWIKIYRLGTASQQVSDGLQATKMRAVAKTRRRELLFDVAGNRVGHEGGTLVPLPPGVAFSTGEAYVPPESGVSIDEPVTFPPAGSASELRAAAFTGKGLPDADPGETFAVYLSNDVGTRVVTMTSAGNIRTREWSGGVWK